jgi:hypothetical protein
MADTPTPPAAATPSTAMEKSERTPVAIGLSPRNFDDGWRMSMAFAKSEIVPKQYRNKPEDILVAIQFGAEIGLPPMQALSSITVINGRAVVWGDGMLAVVLSSPLCVEHLEWFEINGAVVDALPSDFLKYDTTSAVCQFNRRGKDAPIVRRFSVAQARRAQLLGKQGPWQEYPDRMLQMRARMFAARDAFPDLLRGITSAEEVLDMPPLDVEATPRPDVRRMSDRVAVEAADAVEDGGR